MKYTKPPLTIDQQVDLLLSRGLMADPAELSEKLSVVSYYRLSAYLLPFRTEDDHFKPGTAFTTVWQQYVFDRQLRLLVMDAIERVEVAVRTRLVYEFSHGHGPFGYTDRNNLPGLSEDKFSLWKSEIQNELSRSRETFLQHFNEKYGDSHDYPPLWMAAEVMSFGKMLTLYNCVDPSIQRSVSRFFGVEDMIMKSWMGTLNVIRNICAHHGRLWNRELGYKPFIPRRQKYPQWHEPFTPANDRVFSVLTILRYLLRRIAPASRWQERLECLLHDYSLIPVFLMGFPHNWQDHCFWRAR